MLNLGKRHLAGPFLINLVLFVRVRNLVFKRLVGPFLMFYIQILCHTISWNSGSILLLELEIVVKIKTPKWAYFSSNCMGGGPQMMVSFREEKTPKKPPPAGPFFQKPPSELGGRSCFWSGRRLVLVLVFCFSLRGCGRVLGRFAPCGGSACRPPIWSPSSFFTILCLHWFAYSLKLVGSALVIF